MTYTFKLWETACYSITLAKLFFYLIAIKYVSLTYHTLLFYSLCFFPIQQFFFKLYIVILSYNKKMEYHTSSIDSHFFIISSTPQIVKIISLLSSGCGICYRIEESILYFSIKCLITPISSAECCDELLRWQGHLLVSLNTRTRNNYKLFWTLHNMISIIRYSVPTASNTNITLMWSIYGRQSTIQHKMADPDYLKKKLINEVLQILQFFFSYYWLNCRDFTPIVFKNSIQRFKINCFSII